MRLPPPSPQILPDLGNRLNARDGILPELALQRREVLVQQVEDFFSVNERPVRSMWIRKRSESPPRRHRVTEKNKLKKIFVYSGLSPCLRGRFASNSSDNS
jgi:hypothetical protein